MTSKKNENEEKSCCGGGSKPLLLGILIMLVAVGILFFGLSKKESFFSQPSQGKVSASSQDDIWTKTLATNGENIFIMQFVVAGLPQCSYFHYKTVESGGALGIRCFEGKEGGKASYFFVRNQSSDFVGPYKTEKEMEEAVRAAVAPPQDVEVVTPPVAVEEPEETPAPEAAE